MSRRNPEQLERLISRFQRTADDSHQTRERRQKAAARVQTYRQQLQDTQAAIAAEALRKSSQAEPRPKAVDPQLELRMLEDKLDRSIKAVHHFEAFAERAQSEQDHAKRIELVAYWRRRADSAQSRIDELVLFGVKNRSR